MEADRNPILLSAVTRKSRQLQDRHKRDKKKQSKEEISSRLSEQCTSCRDLRQVLSEGLGRDGYLRM